MQMIIRKATTIKALESMPDTEFVKIVPVIDPGSNVPSPVRSPERRRI